LTWPHVGDKNPDDYKAEKSRKFPVRVVADGMEGDIKARMLIKDYPTPLIIA